ncbi:MAG: glutamate--tRNA ligase [Syntrophobacterales bacterium]|nr:MAG: glutamate--tRNA ligase [Syntrophobacterales bacterium]
MSQVRTRFPPSPTGFLHIGGVRTALFNWLFTRHYGGKFILRIEDTDIVRSTEDAVKAILDSMQWLGLDWDEGPFFQSERLAVYQKHVDKLLSEGKAYPCYCTPEELEERRKRALQERKKPKYDGKCRDLPLPYPDGPYAVRFKCPQEGRTVVEDLVKGQIVFENAELDDLIIQRSDGMPTYNFAVVVDDGTMGITHVIRGDDHVNNTPRQILLFLALGYPLPYFAHVPMILGHDRTRLSKRHGAESVMAYKEMGYLPEGLLNYLVRLGWSYGDQEIFSIGELIEKFSLENVGKSAGIFNPEKLRSINGNHMKAREADELRPLLLPFIKAKGYDTGEGEKLNKIIRNLQDRSKTLAEMADLAEFFFKEEIEYDEEAAENFLLPEVIDIFEELIAGFRRVEAMSEAEVESLFRGIAQRREIKLVKVAQPVRVALTGRTVSPGLFEVIDILGKAQTIKRLERAITFIRASVALPGGDNED